MLNQEKQVQRERISRMLRSEDGKHFLEWLSEKQKQETIQIKSVNELLQLGRSQGRFDILDSIQKMREE